MSEICNNCFQTNYTGDIFMEGYFGPIKHLEQLYRLCVINSIYAMINDIGDLHVFKEGPIIEGTTIGTTIDKAIIYRRTGKLEITSNGKYEHYHFELERILQQVIWDNPEYFKDCGRPIVQFD